LVRARAATITPMNKTYSELLRDPRWQKKRLEIMKRDDFQCQRCKATEKPLNVHHKKYLRNRKPWEYSDELLITFCEDCHKAQHPEKTITPKLPPIRPINLSATGFVITWTAFPDNDIPAWEIVEWTGTTMRYGHPEKNEIYVCLDRRGRTFWIDQSDGRLVPRPEEFEIEFDANGRVLEITRPTTDEMAMALLLCTVDGIKHGADFEDGKPNGPQRGQA
jgi:hypothetical protein